MLWRLTVPRLLLCYACLSWPAIQPAHGADFSSWRWKSSIRFGGYVGTESLTGFPAEVCIAESTITGFRYNRFRSGGWKELRFTASDQTTELNYEMEEWNTNGTSIVWVQVPRLAGSNDYIWAFWGKSGQTVPPYTTNGVVWSNHFVGVWHLSEDPTNPAPQMIDSTTNRHHGTAVNMMSADRAAGRAGPALYFDGTDSRVTGGDLGLDPPRYTIEFWAHRKGSSSNWRVILGLASANAVHMWVYDNGTIGWGDSDSTWEGRVSGWTNKTDYHYIAMGVNTEVGSDLYFDGSYCASYGITAPEPWNYLTLGMDGGPSFVGAIDEVRLSAVKRSASWIRNCWSNAVSTNYCVYGKVLPAGGYGTILFVQ